MARQRLNLTLVTEHAVTIIDREGLGALSLSAVANGLGVGPSALYTHVEGLAGLRRLVAVNATRQLVAVVNRAAIGASGNDAIRAMGLAYRDFAQGHPGQFASTLMPPAGVDGELEAANNDLIEIFALVFAAMGLTESEAVLAAQTLRSAIHGFLALEYHASTSNPSEAHYLHLLDTLQMGLTHTCG